MLGCGENNRRSRQINFNLADEERGAEPADVFYLSLFSQLRIKLFKSLRRPSRFLLAKL
jgi:hypothetical protein